MTLRMDGSMASLEQPVGGSSGMRPGWLWAAVVAAALALYVATLAPDLVWQDSGDYQFAAARLDLHRPHDAVRVHPWFLVVAWALGRVGIWSYAYAANLASAIGTALAVGNVVLMVRLVTGRAWPAILGGILFGIGHAVWAHAVMAETYGWAAALVSAECLCAWAWLARRQARWLLLLFLINGVAISNHLMAVLSLAVFGVWVVVACVRGRARYSAIPAAAGCWIVGATLYWIVLGIEYEQTHSLLAALRSGTVGAWGSRIFNLSDLPGLLGKSILYVCLDYPTPLALAMFVGLWVLWRRRETFGRLMVILAVLYFAWAARYKVVDQYAFFIQFYVFGSVLIGTGIAVVWPRLAGVRAWVLLGLALLPIGIYAVLPAAAEKAGFVFFKRQLPHRDPYVYFLRPWRTGDHGARQFAEEVLDALPPRAVLFSDSTPAPPLVCLQELEGRRPDVEIAATGGLPGDRLRHYWGSTQNLMPEFQAEGRRVFVVSDHPEYLPAWMIVYTQRVPFGCVFEVQPRAETPAAATPAGPPKVEGRP
jgi:hypothetical protein